MPLLDLAGGLVEAGATVVEILLGLAAGIQTVIAAGVAISATVPGVRRKTWHLLALAWRRHFDALGHMTKMDVAVTGLREEVRANNSALDRMADTFQDYANRNETQHREAIAAIAAVNVRVDVVQAYMAGKDGGPLPTTHG